MTGLYLAFGASFLAAMTGMAFAAGIRRKKRLRSEIKRLLLAVKNGIGHGGMPLCEVFSTLDASSPEGKKLLSMLKERTAEEAFGTFSALLDDKSAGVLRQFAARLGKSGSLAEEMTLIDIAVERLDELENTVGRHEATKVVLCERLGILLGLALLILLPY